MFYCLLLLVTQWLTLCASIIDDITALSGFEPFGGDKVNASWEAVKVGLITTEQICCSD